MSVFLPVPTKSYNLYFQTDSTTRLGISYYILTRQPIFIKNIWGMYTREHRTIIMATAGSPLFMP